MFDSFNIATLLPLLGVALGWFLSEASTIWRNRRERRAVFGIAVYKLLELRLYLKAEIHHLEIVEVDLKEGGLSDAERMAYRQKEAFSREDLVAMTKDLSGLDPLLATEISGWLKGLYSLLEKGRVYSASHSAAKDRTKEDMFTVKLELTAYSSLLPVLEKTLIRVALRKSLWTWFKVRKVVRTKDLDFGEINKTMKGLKDAFKKLQSILVFVV